MDNNCPDATPADSFIRFACTFCGTKIRVPAKYAGKKGRCPNCKKVVLIPESSTPQPPEKHGEHIRLNRDLDARHLPDQSQLQQSATPQDNTDDFGLRLKPQLNAEPTPVEPTVAEYLPSQIPQQSEAPAESALPWFVDMLAYPISLGGIIHFFIFWLTPILLGLLGPYLFLMCCYGQLLVLAFYILLGGYMLYYFFNCVIESARGRRRAPDVSLQDPPTALELLHKVLLVLACNIVCFAPLIIYVIWFFWTRLRVSPGADLSQFDLTSDVIFWVLYGVGVFLFPMALLAVAMFDSLSALNPGLIIPSIFSTLLPYCGLVVFFYGISYAISRIPPAVRGFGLIYWALQIYAMFISFHLLGLFFHRYEDKLNWEIKL